MILILNSILKYPKVAISHIPKKVAFFSRNERKPKSFHQLTFCHRYIKFQITNLVAKPLIFSYKFCEFKSLTLKINKIL